MWWQDSIAQLPDLILDEPPSGACQLIHAPDAGEIFATSQVDEMVQAFLKYPGAALLDARVDRDAIALPPYISLGQAADFSLAMVKQTLTGEVKQVWNTLAGNRKLFKP